MLLKLLSFRSIGNSLRDVQCTVSLKIRYLQRSDVLYADLSKSVQHQLNIRNRMEEFASLLHGVATLNKYSFFKYCYAISLSENGISTSINEDNEPNETDAAVTSAPNSSVEQSKLKKTKSFKIKQMSIHVRKPWVAFLDEKGGIVIVWDYEAKAIITQMSPQVIDDNRIAEISKQKKCNDDAQFDGLNTDTSINSPTSGENISSRTLSSQGSPGKQSMKTSKISVHHILFYDKETLLSKLRGQPVPCSQISESVIVVCKKRIIVSPINMSNQIRFILSDDLNKQYPLFLEIISPFFFAIGCTDGKIRIWDIKNWTLAYVLETNLTKGILQIELLGHLKKDTSNVLLPKIERSLEFRSLFASSSVDCVIKVWCIYFDGMEFFLENEYILEAKDSKAQSESSTVLDIFFDVTTSYLNVTNKDGVISVWDISDLLLNFKNQSFENIPKYTKSDNKSRKNNVCPIPRTSRIILSSGKITSAQAFLGNELRATKLITSTKDSLLHVSQFFADGNDDGSITQMEINIRRLNSNIPKKIKIYEIARIFGNAALIFCATNFGIIIIDEFVSRTESVGVVQSHSDKLWYTCYAAASKLVSVPISPILCEPKIGDRVKNKHELSIMLSSQFHESPSGRYIAVLYRAAHIFQIFKAVKDQPLQLEMIHSGNGFSFSWHGDQDCFAVIEMSENSQINKSSPLKPRRSLSNFSRSDSLSSINVSNLTTATLSLYRIAGTEIDLIGEGIDLDTNVLGIVSGPVLGVYKYNLEPNQKSQDESKSILSSIKRKLSTESCASASASASKHTVIKHPTFQFYGWDPVENEDVKSMLRIGGEIPAPYLLKWNNSNSLCCLFYKPAFHLYKTNPKFSLMYGVPFGIKAISVLWKEDVLLVATTTEIRCFFFAPSTYFSIVVAQNLSPCSQNKNLEVFDFPTPQRYPGGQIALLAVVDDKLVFAEDNQRLNSIHLNHPLLKFCMLVTQRLPDEAATIVEQLSPQIADWMITFLESFGYYTHAATIKTNNVSLYVELCIKYSLHQDLARMLPMILEKMEDSFDCPDADFSYLQKVYIFLSTHETKDSALQLFEKCIALKKWEDAVLIAKCLSDDKLLLKVQMLMGNYAAAAVTSIKHQDKSNTDQIMKAWNKQLENITIRDRDIIAKVAPTTILSSQLSSIE